MALQNRQLSPFFHFIPSLWFLPQNRPFSSISASFGAKTILFGVFSSSHHWIFSPEISFYAEKISLTRSFCLEFAPNTTFADVEKRKAGVFLSLPHSVRKIQAYFLSKRPHFSRFPPLFYLKPPYPAQNPFHPTRRTRAYAYIRARALSEFAIFAFTLHISPQQTVYQPLECEGKPILHLHLHRNNLIYNTLHDIYCKKSVKAKGWSLHPQLTLAQHFTPKRWRGEGKNRKTLDARVRVRNNKEKALFLWTEQVATIIGAALKTYPVGAAVHEKPDIKSVDLINPYYICLILSQQLHNHLLW